MRSEFSDLYKKVQKLNEKNARLMSDNAELAKRLSAKRYKLMDFLVDSSYRVLRVRNKKRELIGRNVGGAKNDDTDRLKKRREVKREVVRRRVDLINMNFYDWDGKTVYKGGAERYVYDLASLLKEMGYDARILQCSNVRFRKKYHGVEVIGVGAGNKSNIRECSAMYNYYCRDAEFLIASPLELASEIKDIPVVGINHGINFDGVWNKYSEEQPHSYRDYMDALKNVVSCVCVDTNFINFTRTQDYALSLKERYIPNYYDAKNFKKVNRSDKAEKITFVYPRRLYDARGFDITVEAFERILVKYKNKIKLNFVGQIDNDGARSLLDGIMQKFPENVFHFEYTMGDMPKAYADADVVLVPTRYCEGTSLSCIEGMASGSAIITTDVGGLPNLVIDGYNGIIISPVVEDLVDAVEQMIKKPAMRKRMAKNGVKVASEAFTKKRWENSWKREIQKIQETLIDGD